jgi:hypothetical protein
MREEQGMTIYRGPLCDRASKKLNPRYADWIFDIAMIFLLVVFIAFILWDTFRSGGNFDQYFGLTDQVINGVNHGK